MTAHQIAPLLSPGLVSSLLLISVLFTLSSESLHFFPDTVTLIHCSISSDSLPTHSDAKISAENHSDSIAVCVSAFPHLTCWVQLWNSKLLLLQWHTCLSIGYCSSHWAPDSHEDFSSSCADRFWYCCPLLFILSTSFSFTQIFSQLLLPFTDHQMGFSAQIPYHNSCPVVWSLHAVVHLFLHPSQTEVRIFYSLVRSG